jgi:hypothetical protein
VRSVYDLYGAADRVECVQFEAGHNYNLNSRNAVYRFFGKWLLRAEHPETLTEQPYDLGDKRKFLVFGERVRPSWAPEGDKLIDQLIRRRRRQISEFWPANKRQLAAFREQLAPAMAHLLAARVPKAGEVKAARLARKKIGDVSVEHLVLTRPAVGDRVPALLLKPAGKRPSVVTVVASAKGKDALFDARTGKADALVSSLLTAGHGVLLLDCWGIGEAKIPPARDEQAAKIKHYLTYNRSDDANRIQDILTALGYLRAQRAIVRVNLAGLDGAGVWALMARTQAPFVNKTAADLNRMPGTDDAFLRRLLIPAVRGIGDLTTAAALIAPGSLCLHNAGSAVDGEAAGRAFAAAGRPRALRMTSSKLPAGEIARYLRTR